MTDTVIPQLNSHLAVSETITGLILAGKVTPTLFEPDKFAGEYSKVIRDIKAGSQPEDLLIRYGNTLIQSARYAAKSVNGLGEELDWYDVLDKRYKIEIVADEVRKALKALENGDISRGSDLLRRSSATLGGAQRVRSVTADQISDSFTPLMKTGSKAWDTHVGGIATVGITLIGAKTYTGKTTVAISLMDDFMREYPDREVLFVTLEDMNEGWKARAKTILGERNDSFWKRVRVMEFSENVDEIIQEASRWENLGLIVVDYIDYLANESDMNSYTQIYKGLSIGSKSLAVDSKFRAMPVVLLAQFGKGNYKGGVPEPKALLYTGDQFVHIICMLYHAEGDWNSENAESAYHLPADKGYGYLIFWKVKNARPHGIDFPGAIKVPWEPRTGFSLKDEGKWMSLASETKRARPATSRR